MQAFEAVARTGSVTAAARELRISVGAVSQQLRVLEGVLGVALVERSGRGVRLTSWGHQYLPEVAAGFQSLAEAQKKLQRSLQNDDVVISAPASISTRWLANRLFEWSSRRTDVRLRLVTADLEPDLQKGEADFRVTYADHVLDHPHFAELFIDAVTPAASPRLLQDRTFAEPAEVLDFPLIGVDWGPGIDAPPADWPDWLDANGADGSAARAALTFSLSSAAIDAAVAGNGIVLAQLSMIGDDLRTQRLVRPFPDRTLPMPKPYYLAWGSSSLAKPGCRELQRWLLRTSRASAVPDQL